MTRPCVVCEKQYIPTATEQKVCSKHCRKVHASDRQTRNREARGGAISDHDFGRVDCRECGLNFRRFDPNQAYCGQDCKEKYRAREGKKRLRVKLEAIGVPWRDDK